MQLKEVWWHSDCQGLIFQTNDSSIMVQLRKKCQKMWTGRGKTQPQKPNQLYLCPHKHHKNFLHTKVWEISLKQFNPFF